MSEQLATLRAPCERHVPFVIRQAEPPSPYHPQIILRLSRRRGKGPMALGLKIGRFPSGGCAASGRDAVGVGD
jgi:hypothetical protein